MKALCLIVSDRNIFECFILKPIYWPRDLLMQLTGTVWTRLIGDHPGIIPVKFVQIPISGSREDVIWSFPYIIQCKIVTPGRGQFWTQGHNLNNFGRGPLDIAIYQIWKLWAGPRSFRQEDFWKFRFKNLFIDPMTYLCNQLERFEQL